MRRNLNTTQRPFHANTWKSSRSTLTLRTLIENVQRGERLRELRDGQGLTLEDAAHEIGVSTKTLWNWEQGHGIKKPNVKRAAKFYGVEMAWLERGDTPDVLGALGGEGEQTQLDRLDEINRKLDAILVTLGLDPAGDLPEQGCTGSRGRRPSDKSSEARTRVRAGRQTLDAGNSAIQVPSASAISCSI